MPWSRANLSISMNPRLWRVHSYSFPGFPKPTINMTRHKKAQNAQTELLCLFVALFGLLALFFLLALANHFGLGGLFTFRRNDRSDLFLHDTDSGDHDFG